MRMYRHIALALCCASALLCATADDGKKAKATPVVVHQRIDSGCDLVRRGQFLQYRDYSAVVIDGVPGEIYSLELDQSDYIQPTDADGKIPKSASKAGFIVKGFDSGANSTDLPRVVPMATNGGCPSVEEASRLAAKQRDIRRASVQAKLYRPGVDDISRPIPKESPRPKSDAQNDSSNETLPPGKPKVTRGTVVLAIAIGPDGEVRDAKVARSLDPWLDKKAIEAVRSWRFQPARKRGLPVGVLMTVEVNFNLH